MNDQFVGLRFRPTDEEILAYYLEIKMRGHDFPIHAIDEIDFCKHSPWKLPQMSVLPDDRVWYFFAAPSYKYANSKRTERTTSDGYWKITCKDRDIRDRDSKEVIGVRKTLVFYKGRSPNAVKTNWVMHEFHSNNAPRYPKKFVLCRVKRKYDEKYDASQDEPIPFWPSYSGTPAADNIFSQVNREPPVEPEILDFDLDYDELQSLMQMDQGHSHANGFNREPNLLGSQLMRDDEDDFVNSLLVDDDQFYEETVHTRPHGFNPTKPLRGEIFVGDRSDGFNPIKPPRGQMFFGDSSDSDGDTETVHAEFGRVLRNPSLFNLNPRLKPSQQLQGVHSPTITLCSSNRENKKGANGFFQYDGLQMCNLGTDMSDELVLDEFPSSTRACRSQQRLPKSHDFVESTCTPIELKFKVLDESTTGTRIYKSQHQPKSHNFQKESAPRRVQLQGNVSTEAVSRDKGRDAEQAIDLSRKENSNVKLCKDQKMVQITHTKTNLKSESTVSDGNNRKNSSISSQTCPSSNKQSSPLEYLGNVVIGVILVVIFLWELAYLH